MTFLRPMNNTMKILNLARKGTFMNILEMCHMYNISKQGIQIDEKLPDYTNPIYDILLQTYPTQPHYAHSAPSRQHTVFLQLAYNLLRRTPLPCK